MHPTSNHRYWLLIGNVPVGPLGIEEVHAKLAAKEIDWRTWACPVGGNTWSPLLETPGLGPSAPPTPRSTEVAAAPPLRHSYSDASASEVPHRSESMPSIARPRGRLLRLFRSLIAVEAAILVVGLGLTILGLAIVQTPDAPDRPMSPSEGIACIGFVILVPGIIAAWIGMCFLRDWSRWLYLAVTALSHFFSLGSNLFDFSAAWHFPDALGSVGTTIGGVILGMAFLSPLAKEFGRTNADQPIADPWR